jgi:hypothetical protein
MAVAMSRIEACAHTLLQWVEFVLLTVARERAQASQTTCLAHVHNVAPPRYATEASSSFVASDPRLDTAVDYRDLRQPRFSEWRRGAYFTVRV